MKGKYTAKLRVWECTPWYLVINHLQVAWREGHSPKWAREPPWDTLVFCLGYLTLFKCNDFLSDPITQTSQFRAESRNNALSHGTSLPVSPRPSSGSYFAGGWGAGGRWGWWEGGWLLLETVRHDSGRPVGTFEGRLCRCGAEPQLQEDGGWFTASWHSSRGRYQRIWFFLRFLWTEAVNEISVPRHGLEKSSCPRLHWRSKRCRVWGRKHRDVRKTEPAVFSVLTVVFIVFSG